MTQATTRGARTARQGPSGRRSRMAYDLDGSNLTTIAANGSLPAGVASLAVGAGALFWLQGVPAPNPGMDIVSVPLAGGTASTFVASNDTINAIAANSSAIFWSVPNGGGIYTQSSQDWSFPRPAAAA